MEAVNNTDTLFTIVPESSPLMPWKTFKILMTFCFDSQYTEGALLSNHFAVATDMSEGFEKIRMKHGTFHKLWDYVLNLLKVGLVPLTTLVEVLSKENPVQKCYECGALVTVKDITMPRSKRVFIPDLPILMFGGGVVFALCGKSSCFLSLERGPFKMTEDRLLAFYEKLRWEYKGELCDYCDGINEEGKSHRCAKCKTKIYCGIECLNKDKVHLMLCQEGDTRKQKPSSSSRRERWRKRFEEVSTAVSKCWVEGAPMPVRF